MNSEVRLERQGAIAVVTVDRPGARNAIDRAAMAALENIVREIELDTSLVCAIITGAGDHFIAGGDLKDFVALERNEEGRRMSRAMQSVLWRWSNLPLVTIAAIDGDAYGGGCEVALSCDLRVIKSSARLVFRQVSMGLTPGWGGGQRLSRLIGNNRAIRIFATGATVSPSEALEMGLVDQVADRSALAEARTLAEEIAAQPHMAVRNMKRAITHGASMPLERAIAFEAELFAETWNSPDHRAAVEVFLKRWKH